MKKKGLRKIMGAIFAGITGFAAIAVIVLLAVSGVFKQPAYLEPWDKTYASQFEDPRIRLTAHGLLAANGHNMQPWKIRLDQDDPMVFYLYADSGRLTGQVDPLARQMMVTQGAFLEYVRIGGEQLGYKTEIELFPQGEYEEGKLAESMNALPVARITLAQATHQSAPFYDYMFLPDTNRGAYQPTKLSSEEINALEHVTAEDHMSIKIFQDQENMDKLGDYAIRSASIEAAVSRVMKESEVIFRPNEYDKNRYRYGFSIEGQGTAGIMKHLMQGLVTLFPSMNSGKAAANMLIQSTQKAVEHTPAYAMIITKDNTRADQVKSGMAYSKLILAAHGQGLAMQPLSQALEEYPEMSQLYSAIHEDYAPEGGTIQMLMRLGDPAKEVPHSMRRDAMDLIVRE